MAIKLIKDLIQFIPIGIPKAWTEVREVDPERPTVILISGFGAYPGSLRVMRKRLIRDGFNVVIQTLSFQDAADGIAGFPWLAQKLRQLISQLRTDGNVREQKVFIVAHSAGGLVARYYIQILEGHKECDGLVTLATPHQGILLAALGFFTHLIVKAKCLYDILPFSPFVRNLNGAQFPSGFPMASLYSLEDALCPVKTTRLPVNISQGNKVIEKAIPETSHMEFLLKKRSYEVVKQWMIEQGVELSSTTPQTRFKKSS